MPEATRCIPHPIPHLFVVGEGLRFEETFMPRFAANLSMLFTEVDFLDRFAAAAEAGFSGVEYLFPYDFPVEEIRARLDSNKLTQVLFNLPAGDWGKGE